MILRKGKVVYDDLYLYVFAKSIFNQIFFFCPQSGVWREQIHCVQTKWKSEFSFLIT